jgi:hypothetical protein
MSLCRQVERQQESDDQCNERNASHHETSEHVGIVPGIIGDSCTDGEENSLTDLLCSYGGPEEIMPPAKGVRMIRRGVALFLALTCSGALDLSLAAASNEFRLTKDGVGPIVIVTDIKITGKEALLKASARNDSGQPIRFAKFCVAAEGRTKGCDFELWTTATWKAGEELTWTPLRGSAHVGLDKANVTLTEFDTAVSLPAPSLRAPQPAASPAAGSSVTNTNVVTPTAVQATQPESVPPTPVVQVQRQNITPVQTQTLPAEQNSAGLSILDGTPLRIRTTRTISSADAKVGETVDFEVLEEVRLGSLVVIPKGGIALGTVTEAASKKSMGRGGKLNVVIDHAKLVTGDKMPLRAIKENQGGGHVGAMTGAIVATSIVFFPAAPLFLFVKGKDIIVPKGTEITAYVNGDYHVDLGKFGIVASPQTAQQPSGRQAAPSAPPVITGVLTNDDVISLKQGGLGDDVILAKIKTSKGFYKIDTDGIVALKKAGVSDAVILGMIDAAGR